MIWEINLLIMSLLSIIIVIVVVGLILYLINTYLPMDAKIKSNLNVVVVIVLIIYLLKVFGLLSGIENVRI